MLGVIRRRHWVRCSGLSTMELGVTLRLLTLHSVFVPDVEGVRSRGSCATSLRSLMFRVIRTETPAALVE